MAFLRFHNTGINTDAIVRWHDDETKDTLLVILRGQELGGVPTTLRVYGEQREALLRYLTRHSVGLSDDDRAYPTHHGWLPEADMHEGESH